MVDGSFVDGIEMVWGVDGGGGCPTLASGHLGVRLRKKNVARDQKIRICRYTGCTIES